MSGIYVPFIADGNLEADATRLLEEYTAMHGWNRCAPVPVEEILEFHLGYTLDLDDLMGVFGVDDVLGATWLKSRQVVIDESLDPEANPRKEGRFHFTIGHEIAHIRVHRSFIEAAFGVGPLSGARGGAQIVCRTSQDQARIELQADRYAAFLLMPEDVVRTVWERKLRHAGPLNFHDVPNKGRYRMQRRGAEHISTVVSEVLVEIRFFDEIAAMFAPIFKVSKQAMRYRLQKLGLLINDPQRSLFDD